MAAKMELTSMHFTLRWLAVALASVVALPMYCAAQTITTAGAGEVRSFWVRNATTVDAATYGGGLFTSTNSGQSWSRVALPGNARYLTGVAGRFGSYMFVSAEEGVFRSTDGVNFTRRTFDAATAVAVAPGTSPIVLAGVRGAGILRSTDGGLAFTLANMAGVTSTDITAIAFHPTDPNIAYFAARPDNLQAGGGVFRSSDGGQTWIAFGPPAPDTFVYALTVLANGTVYAGVIRNFDGGNNQGAVWFRTAGSATWTQAGNTFGGFTSLHVDANDATRVWAGGRQLGLLRGTTTFDYQFTQNGTPNFFYTGVNAVATFPGSATVLKALRGAGIYRSTSGFDPWNRSDLPGADRVTSATGVAGSNSVILMGLSAGGVWRSDNTGSTFSNFTNGFAYAGGATGTDRLTSVWSLAASATNPGLVYAATGGVNMFHSGGPTGVFLLSGTTWNGVNEAGLPFNNGAQPYGVAVNRGNDQIAYAAFLTGSSAIFTRSGSNWTGQIPPGSVGNTRTFLTTSNSQKLFAMLFDDKPVVSTNGGASYSTVSVSQLGFERIRFFSMAENPTNANFYVAGTNKGLLRSTDGGNSWQRITMAPVFLQSVITGVGFRPGTGIAFAGDYAGNRYCSSNGGTAWIALTPLRAGIVGIQAIGTELYYLTDGSGLVRETQSC
jgi:hypothetical protein